MSRDNDCCTLSAVSADVSTLLSSSLLALEATEASEINIFILLNCFLHDLHERFNNYKGVTFFNTCLFSDFRYDFSFCHDFNILIVNIDFFFGCKNNKFFLIVNKKINFFHSFSYRYVFFHIFALLIYMYFCVKF